MMRIDDPADIRQYEFWIYAHYELICVSVLEKSQG